MHRDLDQASQPPHENGNGGTPGGAPADLQIKDVPQLGAAPPHDGKLVEGDLDQASQRLHENGNGGTPGGVLDDLQIKDVPQLVEAPPHDGNLGDGAPGLDLHLDVLHLGLGLEVEGKALDFGSQVHFLRL